MSNLLRFPTESGLHDASERADALDIHQSWIVEAPAGSGKTGLLIQRYLKLLADESVTEPEQVLAITFTTKATAEMRERVLAQLQSAADSNEPGTDFDRATRQLADAVLERDRELRWSLLHQPHRLRIKTIDSVSSEIANSLPLLSGSGGRRTPSEDASPLYALAAHRTFLALGGPDRDLHEALSNILLHRDGNLADCEKLLGEMLALRDQWGQLIHVGRARLDDAWLDTNVLPQLQRTLEQAICATLKELAEAIPAGFIAQLTLAAEEMAQVERLAGKSSLLAVCAGRLAPPEAVVEDLDHWRALIHLLATKKQTWRKSFARKTSNGAMIAAIVENLQDNDAILTLFKKLDSLPPAQYPLEQWAVAKSLFRVLKHGLAELQLVFAERGECDFVEVSLAARIALTSSDGPHDLEASLGSRLQHILVDEMQDTSSGQYELIEALTQNWDGHSQTVFLVGDPKQSIYMFRQARVERFLRTMHSGQIGDLPLGVLHLTANFRSQADLVDEFNADFGSIFPIVWDVLRPEEVPYVRAYAVRRNPMPNELSFNSLESERGPLFLVPRNALDTAADASTTSRVWHGNVLAYETDKLQKDRNTRAQRQSDALEVCRIVRSWRSRPIPPNRTDPWKIAVLCRSRNHLDEIVAAFKSAAIPFRAVDIDPLKERPEVQDLIALTRALLHPADRVAWLAILRAPWCALSLAELHTLTGADDPAWARSSMQQVIAERGHMLPDEACQRLQRIWSALEAAVESRARMSVAQLVERTWRSLGGDAYLNAAELGNASRYLQLLGQIEAEILGSSRGFELSELDRRIDKLYAAPGLERDAVEVLTIHKAKGLEWDVVIVPGLERRAPASRGRLLNWVQFDPSDEKSAHVVLAPIAGKGESSLALSKWIRSIHNAREAAERKRVFYVACTRAREELHLFAAPTRSAKGEINPIHNSLLAAAWPAASSHFAEVEETHQPLDLAAAAEPAPESAASQSAPLRRLPLHFDPAGRFVNRFPVRYGNDAITMDAVQLERPEGSLAARAFGNAVHAFLELITLRMAANETPAKLLGALPAWIPRIKASLRAEGLHPAAVERLTQRVSFALETTLNDAVGIWLLSPHPGAATEYGLTAWSAQRSNIRIDRIFHAGREPLTDGDAHRWIVDYKTSTHGAEGIDAFLASERMTYSPQLEAYADVVSRAQEPKPICLALYYPLMAKLIWWAH